LWLLLDQCVFAEDHCADLIAGEIGVEDIHGHGGQISTGLGLFDGHGHGDLGIIVGGKSDKDAVDVAAAYLGGTGFGTGGNNAVGKIRRNTAGRCRTVLWLR